MNNMADTMPKDKIAQLLKQATLEAQQKGLLPQFALPDIILEHPQSATHGDYACNYPLKLSRLAKANPLEIAQSIVSCIPSISEVEKVEVAAPGFINFTLKNDWLARQVDAILLAGEAYGNIEYGKGSRTQVEFVSVNPTGPLHVGHGRGAILGSALANVLAAAGYSVEREYYINDAGTQMDNFYKSLYARYQQAFDISSEIPADGYHGSYVIDIAKEIIAEKGDSLLNLPYEQAIAEIGKIGIDKVLTTIKNELNLMEVHFNVWFSEKSLFEDETYNKAMSILRNGGHIAEKEGAIWFVSSDTSDDKDNVLVRSNGTPTYFASDIAYHYNKFIDRKFNRVIDIWGADHHGHIPRMKAVMRALSIDPACLQILITQMVTLKRGNDVIKISKRSGEIITLQEVLEEVGADACRYFFLSRSADSQMDFDLELAKKESAENPVYYIQYAHARIASILRLAQEKGIDYSQGDTSLLVEEAELTLLRKMIQLPEVIETIARNLEPHHLPHYTQEVATLFHSFYKQCRVVTDDEPLTQARLKLVKAAKTVFARSLSLMGMSTPDTM